MTDKQILTEIKKYFSIHELVGEEVYIREGLEAWRFLDVRLLQALLIVRKGINKKITVNNYEFGGGFQQRGLRSNMSEIVQGMTRSKRLYLSAHVLGKAIDFDVEGMTAAEVRYWILQHEDLFPFKIRLEGGVNWVHLDVMQEVKNPKVYIFNP